MELEYTLHPINVEGIMSKKHGVARSAIPLDLRIIPHLDHL
jgi:hypothetical protein